MEYLLMFYIVSHNIKDLIHLSKVTFSKKQKIQ